ncbi:protein GLUTAMINE DUMPER 4-like [Panicum miliaceum]|uniref:Protein GLUTAMINE DUMPER 4-like n=1 Tax=Panicum miliaceum TaxID=4540 RepID=A0A3L6RTN0_PANMI|nr:protein GLUTAMINE DUMPER 4-like [Panicum miliaceum]
MAMEDRGGASSSVAQPGMADYGRHFQPPPFWSTPTPYLFIGFAVVMALIAVALAVLLCTRRKEGEGRGAEGEVMAVRVVAPLGREDAAVPKVLVVMAGHSAPSFLASAAPFASFAAAGDDAKPQHGGGGGGGKYGDDAV